MNLPNKLTVIRMLLCPILMFFLLLDIPHSYLISVIIFIGASLTDLFDGKIARRDNLITNFGKFLDPLADKMLVNAAFVGFMANGIFGCGPWLLFIVLTREFLISSLRLVAAGNGNIIAAGKLGKLKTITQMTAIIAVMVFEEAKFFLPDFLDIYLDWTGCILLWISTVMAVISGIEYLYVNRKFVDHRK